MKNGYGQILTLQRNYHVCVCVPGHRSWHSSLLLAGWSRYPIPVGARSSAPVQTGRGDQRVSYMMGTAYRKIRAIPLSPFWTCMACSRLNFNFTLSASTVDVPVAFLVVVYFTTLFVSETAQRLKLG